MEREGPGFLADLAIFYLAFMVCAGVIAVVGHFVPAPFRIPLALAAVFAVIVGTLQLYYRLYLDERPILGTESRSRFVVLSIQLSVIGFLIVISFLPSSIHGVSVVGAIFLSLLLSYGAVYRWDLTGSAPEKTQNS